MHQTNALAPKIDHTLLKPDAAPQDIRRLCNEAAQYGFAAVCVMPVYVPLAKQCLGDTAVRVATVIGFPLGATRTAVKAEETRDAVAHGADELDMVLQIGLLKAGDTQAVLDDVRAVVTSAAGRLVKVILETALLTEDEIIRACNLAMEAGAHYVKTSTGFGPGGATVEVVRLMRQVVGRDLGVKASGGIRDAATAQQMIEAGASRLGTSAGVAIIHAQAGADTGY